MFRNNFMKRWRWPLLVLLALAGPGLVTAGENGRGLVLVADAGAPSMAPLTAAETRRLYLGMPVTRDGRRLEPLLNLADERLYDVFLQKVMFMSASAYQRQLTQRFLHGRGLRPAVYRDRAALFAALAANPEAVTYVMWRDEAERHADLQVVAVLWDGDS